MFKFVEMLVLSFDGLQVAMELESVRPLSSSEVHSRYGSPDAIQCVFECFETHQLHFAYRKYPTLFGLLRVHQHGTPRSREVFGRGTFCAIKIACQVRPQHARAKVRVAFSFEGFKS